MLTLEELRRVMSEMKGKAFGEITEDMIRINQRLASLEQDVRQPRLAMEVDANEDKKTPTPRRAPLLQFDRSMGITVLQKGSKSARNVLLAAVMTSLDLWLSLVQGMMS